VSEDVTVFDALHSNRYIVSNPGETRTLRARFWFAEILAWVDVIESDGGLPDTGTTKMLALLDIELPGLVTVTVHEADDDIAGNLKTLFDVATIARSSAGQAHWNVRSGCSLGPKLGSNDEAALILPPELPIEIDSPPEIIATGGNCTNSNRENTRYKLLTTSSTE